MLAMDRNGEIITHMTYDEWGKPLEEPRLDHNFAGIKNLNNYTGYTYDYVLDLYFAQNRFYNPDTRQFITQDPIKSGMNWYVYCDANPLVNVDWWGLANTSINIYSAYGNIYDLDGYIEKVFGLGWTLVESKVLRTQTFVQSDFSGLNNCTVTALARVFAYQRDNGEYCRIPDNDKLYDDIMKIAKDYGYSDESGTPPTKINNIIDELIKLYGYTGSGKSHYISNFSSIVTEIDAGRPLLLNIATGYYENHTVTITGYYKYQRGNGLIKQTKRFLKVHEGWTSRDAYIDYDVYASSTYGSYSTIILY